MQRLGGNHGPGRTGAVVGTVVAAALLALWYGGGFAELASLAIELQRRFQEQLALVLRQLKQGEAGAVAALMVLCFLYGFLHAAGPGHGKFLMSGYGLARDVRLWPLVTLALAASLAQAAVAVALVYAGVAILSLTRDQVLAMSSQSVAAAGAAVMGLIGLWLLLRGAAGLWRQVGGGGHPGRAGSGLPDHGASAGTGGTSHSHSHSHDANAHCGHNHGPTAEQVANVAGWREALLLIGAVALRPCSGALLLLVLTWQMGIAAAGIAGAFAMALGTGLVVVSVAVMAHFARSSVAAIAARFGWLSIVAPAMELAVGAGIALVAVMLLAG